MGRSANFSLLKSSCFSLLLGKLKFALLKWRTRQLKLERALVLLQHLVDGYVPADSLVGILRTGAVRRYISTRQRSLDRALVPSRKKEKNMVLW